jgi:hypothetical protein
MILSTVRRTASALLLLSAPLAAQAEKEPARIADNSFLVEEAYNQETGVVQHIGAFRRAPDRSWLFTFTQEWPAPSQRHQFSYTAAVLSSVDAGAGVGDLALNYRFQALGKDDEPVWFSPRLSVLFPTGDVNAGRSVGGPGVQVNLPLSIDVSESLVTHWNAGATLINARNAAGARRTVNGVSAAASAIWLVAPTFNLMLESVWDRAQALDDAGVRHTEASFVLVPGARAAINLRSGMQIVPGVGIPIGVGPSRGERDVFLYLSVEHSFR